MGKTFVEKVLAFIRVVLFDHYRFLSTFYFIFVFTFFCSCLEFDFFCLVLFVFVQEIAPCMSAGLLIRSRSVLKQTFGHLEHHPVRIRGLNCAKTSVFCTIVIKQRL